MPRTKPREVLRKRRIQAHRERMRSVLAEKAAADASAKTADSGK